MKLKIYNTMTHKKEDFVPLMEDLNYDWVKKDFVWIYSCWPTVYSSPHLWNMRATFVADMINNVIKNILWYNTKLVSNITDVWHLVWDGDDWEDKMEKWSQKDGITARDVAKKYENEFRNNMTLLNIWFFDEMPRATDHIQEQIDLLKILEQKWYIYEIEDNWIYMDTSKVEDYGKLMWPNYKKRLENLRSWVRVSDTGKKHPTDFALWKFSPKGEQRQMERDSPRWIWFPGWHIECSAMSSKYLWEQFDIHTWWKEHITVHHSDEIAQSECAYWKKPWVKYWLHNEWLMFDWTKWSKTEGNAYTVSDVIKNWYSIDSLRYFYFLTHYRKQQNFSRAALKEAETRVVNIVSSIHSVIHENIEKQSLLDINYKLNFKDFANINFDDSSIKFFNMLVEDSLLNDFNTSKLIADINKLLSHNVLEKHNQDFWSFKIFVDDVIKFILFLDHNLLKLWLIESLKKTDNNLENIKIPWDIQKLAEERLSAKNNKDWATADKIRDDLKLLWWNILDRPNWFDLEKL